MDETQLPVARSSHPADVVATLVLAEDETDMWLASVAFPRRPEAGARFHFRGQVWQVVWVDAPGCGAEPLIM